MRQLSWTHLIYIIPLDHPLKRDFYAEMCRLERWSVRTLQKKIGGMLFERTALSKKPDQLIRQELDALREEDQLTPNHPPNHRVGGAARSEHSQACTEVPRKPLPTFRTTDMLSLHRLNDILKKHNTMPPTPTLAFATFLRLSPTHPAPLAPRV